MSDYTPDLSEIRDVWGLAVDVHRRPERLAQFDRALAAHDAEIRADAWDEGFDSEYDTITGRPANPYRTPRPPAPELIPGVQAAVDALSIYRKGKP